MVINFLFQLWRFNKPNIVMLSSWFTSNHWTVKARNPKQSFWVTALSRTCFHSGESAIFYLSSNLTIPDANCLNVELKKKNGLNRPAECTVWQVHEILLRFFFQIEAGLIHSFFSFPQCTLLSFVFIIWFDYVWLTFGSLIISSNLCTGKE